MVDLERVEISCNSGRDGEVASILSDVATMRWEPLSQFQRFSMCPRSIFVICLIMIAGCRRQEAGTRETLMASRDDSMFAQVKINVNDRNPCSPAKPVGGWHGVLINAPRQVRFKPGKAADGAFATIPICGTYSLDLGKDSPEEPLTLYAFDKETGHLYAGEVIEADRSPKAPLPPDLAAASVPRKVPGQFMGGYFNPNLAEHARLPQRAAVYDVYVQMNGLKSNVVSVELVPVRP